MDRVHFAALLAIASTGVGCSDAEPPSVREQTSSNTAVATRTSVPDVTDQNFTLKETSDSLITKIRRHNWNDFESELRQYLGETTDATEASDRLLTEVTNTIEQRIATSDPSDTRYFSWRTKASRLIIQNHKPLTTTLSTKLAGHLSYLRTYTLGDLEPTATENRFADARLILQVLKQVHDAIDLSFDPDDKSNLPMTNVAVPSGQGRYLAGIDPKQVEPELRENYLHAIAQNEAKNQKMQQQRRAREDEKKLREIALRYISRAYSQPPGAFAEEEQLLNELIVNAETKAEILAESRDSVPKIEAKIEAMIKTNRQNEEELAKLRAEGAIE